MREVFAAAAAWSEQRRPYAIATLVAMRDAAPAPLGASMAVAGDGTIVGDIGAGCYESAIVEATVATCGDGVPRLLAIDLADDDVLTGANGCGGTLEVVTWRPGDAFAGRAGEIGLGNGDVTLRIPYQRHGVDVAFETVVQRRRTLVIVGATALAGEIAALAKRLDFRSVVVDPRPAFATPQRLAAVDEIVVAWPDEVLAARLTQRTPLLVVSHDPKIDLPALRTALASDAPYVGLLGSRRAQGARRAALQAEGWQSDALARIRGPVGLDLGAGTVAETAVSIVAEILAAGHARSGGPLARAAGAIHGDRKPSPTEGRGRRERPLIAPRAC